MPASIQDLTQRVQELRAIPLEQRNTLVIRKLAQTELTPGEQLLASGEAQAALVHLTEALRLFQYIRACSPNAGSDECAGTARGVDVW